MKNDIKLHSVIINGNPTSQLIKDYTDNGWVYLGLSTADKFHPYAIPTDHILFFAKPVDKEAYDKEMEEIMLYEEKFFATKSE